MMMLKGSCNVKIQSLTTQCGLWIHPKRQEKLVGKPRNNISSAASGRQDLSVSISTKETDKNGSARTRNKSLEDRLRLGSMSQDELSYKENFIVRSYEVGINKTATVETIANLLQEVGCNHVQVVGFSTDGFATTLTMRKLHLIWVTARVHIEIYRYPAWSDVVEIETWCQPEGKIGIRRDFILRDYVNDELIGRATSKWVMMNMDTRKLERVSSQIAHEYLPFCPKQLRLAFPEENNKSVRKISKLVDPSQYSKLGLMPRRADLDMNRHVNNVTYIGWVLESIPGEVMNTHELESITLDYRQECQQDHVVDSLATTEATPHRVTPSVISHLKGTNGGAPPYFSRNNDDDDNDDNTFRFLHLLRFSFDGSEINRGRTEWRRKQRQR